MEPKILKTDFIDFQKAVFSGKNESGYHPFGDRVLILPDQALDISTGGVVFSQETVARQSMAAMTGAIIAIGDGAFEWNADRTRPFKGRKPQAGDRVNFQRYAGQGLFGKDGKHYRLMDDNTIGAVEL